MERSSKSRVLLLAIAFASIGLGAWWWSRSSEPTRIGSVAPGPSVQGVPSPSAQSAGQRDQVVAPDAVETARPRQPGDRSTVAWPAKVELELVQPLVGASEPGVPVLGAGRSARIKGLIVGRDGSPVRAIVRFTHGFNEGRELVCNQDGAFGASDLYPGLSIVRADAPGYAGTVREIVLRQNVATELNLTFDHPTALTGRVFDALDSKELADVEVAIDGQVTTTNEAGEFRFDAITGGERLFVVLRKRGYASQREPIAIAVGRPVPRDRYKFSMRPSCTLRLTLGPIVGPPGEATIVLTHSSTFASRGDFAARRSYPFHAQNPIRLQPGRSAVIDDLPEGDLDVRAFYPGATLAPPVSKVTLVPGVERALELRFEPAAVIEGVVTSPGGDPLENVAVRVEAPDRVGAMLNHVGQPLAFLETEVFPTMPAMLEVARTDFSGRYRVTAWERAAPTRYLIAESADGTLTASRVVRAADRRVDLQLAPREVELATLSIDLPGRFQAVPVETTINGVPFPEQMVAATEPLTIDNLEPGVWRLRVTWNGEAATQGSTQVRVEKRTSHSVKLPQGAIDGQDEDTLRRAGRL